MASLELPSLKSEQLATQNLVNYAIYLRQNGYAQDTIETRIRALNQLKKHANLNDAEQVKIFIMENQNWKKSTKKRYAQNYQAYLKYLGVTWKIPRIIPERKLPFIPTEEEIDQLIASTGKNMAVALQTLKETGIRGIELTRLKWSDLDTQRRTLNITPAKGSNPRLLPISNKLIDMLNRLPRRRKTIFPSRKCFRTMFNKQRKRSVEKLQNPRIQRITLHTFRHFKGTMEYHKTKSIAHVRNLLGHRNVNNTMIYINLESAIFHTKNDQFYAQVSHNEQEAIKLVEAGFEYVTDLGQNKLFRKRK